MLCLRCVLVKGIPTRWSVQALYVRSQRDSSLWIWMEPRNSCLRFSPAILMENPSRLKLKAMCLSSAQGRTKSQCMYVSMVAYVVIWSCFEVPYYNLITFLSFQHKKLALVSDCMKIIMTINGVDCKARVLDNEITCRKPKNLTIPSQGAPVKVRVCLLNSALISSSWLCMSFIMDCFVTLCFSAVSQWRRI